MRISLEALLAGGAGAGRYLEAVQVRNCSASDEGNHKTGGPPTSPRQVNTKMDNSLLSLVFESENIMKTAHPGLGIY